MAAPAQGVREVTRIRQSTNTVLMVAPAAFASNAQAAEDNHFMAQVDGEREAREVRERVAQEYEGLVRMLQQDVGLDVRLFSHTPEHGTPDAVFPNNWFSTSQQHQGAGGGSLVLYPMKAPNRRLERRKSLIDAIQAGGSYPNLIDLSHHEEETHGARVLEGTGSLVLDHVNRIAYVSLSERADESLAKLWGETMGFAMVTFAAKDGAGRPIYHTNVMMSVGTHAAIVCREAMEPTEYDRVAGSLQRTGHAVIDITLGQMNDFAGNALEVVDGRGALALCVSSRAWASLTQEQVSQMRRYWGGGIHHAPIPTLEEVGGGGVRCTMAELF